MDSKKHTFDIFVIGGGINGAGIARDASGRGLKVCLADMGDLGGATSSSSTKLFHGGLRYLEYFEFKLIKESLKEREVLLTSMPHISWPMRFVLPYHDGIKFEAWGGKTDEWGTRLIKAGLKRGYAVAVVDAFYKRGITPGSKLKFPYAIQIGITLRNILSKSENIDSSKMFYTGFSYGAGEVLELQGKRYSNQNTFKAAVAAEPGCNQVPNPVKVNISTLIIKGEESHYHPVACKSYLEMIKNVNNKVKYVSIPKADHHFSLNGKIGTGKAFNGCSNNIVIRYFDGTWKHMDGTLTSRNETKKKCMTNNKAGVNSKTSEKLDEAIEIALNFIDKNN